MLGMEGVRAAGWAQRGLKTHVPRFGALGLQLMQQRGHGRPGQVCSQNSGPFLGTLNNMGRLIRTNPKGSLLCRRGHLASSLQRTTALKGDCTSAFDTGAPNARMRKCVQAQVFPYLGTWTLNPKTTQKHAQTVRPELRDLRAPKHYQKASV